MELAQIASPRGPINESSAQCRAWLGRRRAALSPAASPPVASFKALKLRFRPDRRLQRKVENLHFLPKNVRAGGTADACQAVQTSLPPGSVRGIRPIRWAVSCAGIGFSQTRPKRELSVSTAHRHRFSRVLAHFATVTARMPIAQLGHSVFRSCA